MKRKGVKKDGAAEKSTPVPVEEESTEEEKVLVIPKATWTSTLFLILALVMGYMSLSHVSSFFTGGRDMAFTTSDGDKCGKYRASANNGDATSQFMMGICYSVEMIPAEITPPLLFESDMVSNNNNVNSDDMSNSNGNNGIVNFKDDSKSHESSQSYMFAEDAYEEAKKTAQYEAYEWMSKAAKNGHSRAQFMLFFYNYKGIGVERNDKYAFQLLSDLIASTSSTPSSSSFSSSQQPTSSPPSDADTLYPSGENAEALYLNYFGKCFEEGRGVEKNATKAVEYYGIGADARYDAISEYELGRCYADGVGLDRSFQRALTYLQRAADKGHATAALTLSRIFASGSDAYTQQQQQQNIEIHKISETAPKISDSLPAIPDAAFAWIEKSVSLGLVEAMWAVGDAYAHSRLGRNKDEKEAFYWLDMASKKGFAKASEDLAEWYSTGRFVARNVTAFVEYTRLAALQGSIDAMQSLSRFYKDGAHTLKRSNQEAMRWQRRAKAGEKKKLSFLSADEN